MMQTKIDQFYKVTSNSRKPSNIKTLNVKNPAITKIKEKQVQNKSKMSMHQNDKHNSNQMNQKQEASQDNISLNSKTFSPRFDTYNSPIKVTENRIVTSPIIKHTSPIITNTPVSPRSKFIPKTSSPIKEALDRSQGRAKMARRRLFEDKIDELTSKTINNLNLANEGAIVNNYIDLEKVYSSKNFNYQYNPIDTTVSTKYELNDVVKPTDTYSLHFFLAIVSVFSNPVNCGYFSQDELELVFSLITLPKPMQDLLIRMLKRKYAWHRVKNIIYDDISNNLKPIFDELVSRSIFKSNIEEEDITVLLNLLQADEIFKLCQESKIHVKGKKKMIQAILTFCHSTKSLFPGMVSPANKLRASVNKRLGDCIILNTKVKEVVDRIITLLIPNQDPTETLVDAFLTLLKVETDQIKFPVVTISDFPIFASKKHILDYMEAKSTLTNILKAIEKKQWQIVRDLGILAAQRLPLFLETESLQDSSLPSHIRHFMPGYMWLKVLYKSIDAFKKTVETMSLATKFLRMLIDQDCHMKYKKGQWYCELIKIEMYHKKNLDVSVRLLSDAMAYQRLTEVDKLDLLDRAEMIAKRKSGIDKNIKATVKHMLDNVFSKTQLTFQSSTTIQGTLRTNTSQKKSTWCISNGTDEQIYGSVETLALYRYKCEGYTKGVHCEGAFPITVFATLFWDEIYNVDIPGVWVSLYQDAPLDLHSSEFYEGRKQKIDMKLELVRTFNAETLSNHMKHQFELCSEYKSIFQGNIFDNSNSFQEVVFCLGVQGIIGICKRLIYNFPLWKAGFPDLIVWNAHTKQYKIVEVKGPGDSLSTKQKLWLDYLNRLGLNTEVCYCKSDNHTSGRKRKHEEIVINE